MIKLSIIIPHYNSILSLEKLLSTIPNKNDIEVIIVDDRSNEHGLEDIINKFNLPNVVLLINNKNIKGAGVCRNLGIKKARGHWILFADADDFFVKDFYNIIKCYFSSSYDVVFFVPTSIETDTNRLSNRHIHYKNLVLNYLNKPNYKTLTKLKYQYYVPWSKLYSRTFLIKHNILFDELIASNDINFSTKVGYHMKSFDVSKYTVYCVTKNKGSLTVNRSNEVFIARLTAYIDYCNFLKGKLCKAELKVLELKGTGFLINVFKYRLGIKMFFMTFSRLKNNKIKIMDKSFFNPIVTINKVIRHIKSHNYNRKYYN